MNYYKIWRLSMFCFSMVTVYLILTRFTNTCTDLICHTYPISDCFKLPQHSSSVCQMCTGILLFLFLFFLTFRVYSILDNPDLNSSICFKSIQVFFLSFYCFNFFLSLWNFCNSWGAEDIWLFLLYHFKPVLNTCIYMHNFK